MEHSKYYVVKKKAVPEVLLKVIEAKRYLESGEIKSVQDAVDAVGISRSSFYKYKDDISEFHDNARGKSITFVLQMEDAPGLLSLVLKTIARYDANVLTINQTIPINGMASLTLTVDLLPTTGDVSSMIEEIESQQGIHYLKILLPKVPPRYNININRVLIFYYNSYSCNNISGELIKH